MFYRHSKKKKKKRKKKLKKEKQVVADAEVIGPSIGPLPVRKEKSEGNLSSTMKFTSISLAKKGSLL